MHTAPLSCQRTFTIEDDGESGIGSTLDLTGSSECYSEHPNHLLTVMKIKMIGRDSGETGTRQASRAE